MPATKIIPASNSIINIQPIINAAPGEGLIIQLPPGNRIADFEMNHGGVTVQAPADAMCDVLPASGRGKAVRWGAVADSGVAGLRIIGIFNVGLSWDARPGRVIRPFAHDCVIAELRGDRALGIDPYNCDDYLIERVLFDYIGGTSNADAVNAVQAHGVYAKGTCKHGTVRGCAFFRHRDLGQYGGGVTFEGNLGVGCWGGPETPRMENPPEPGRIVNGIFTGNLMVGLLRRGIAVGTPPGVGLNAKINDNIILFNSSSPYPQRPAIGIMDNIAGLKRLEFHGNFSLHDTAIQDSRFTMAEWPGPWQDASMSTVRIDTLRRQWGKLNSATAASEIATWQDENPSIDPPDPIEPDPVEPPPPVVAPPSDCEARLKDLQTRHDITIAIYRDVVENLDMMRVDRDAALAVIAKVREDIGGA